VVLALVAIAAVTFVVVDRGPGEPATAAPSSSSPKASPAQPQDVALPVVVVGANCSPLGAAGITSSEAPAYCAHLSATDATIWSLYPGEVSSPTVTPGADDAVYPSDTEAPVLVCMEQTGQSHLDCHDGIVAGNGSPPPS
jgi:serine/threonine-protein kinase